MRHIFNRRPKVPERWWLTLVILSWLLLIALAHVTEIYWDNTFEDALRPRGEE